MSARTEVGTTVDIERVKIATWLHGADLEHNTQQPLCFRSSCQDDSICAESQSLIGDDSLHNKLLQLSMLNGLLLV